MVDESPFSFADPEHLRHTLESAGFSEIIIQSHDEKASSGDLDAMTFVFLKVGPLGKIVRANAQIADLRPSIAVHSNGTLK
jgi:hypothetical protein